MKKDFRYPSKDGRTSIHALEWIPDGEVKAVVQIVHGMVEFVDRYDRIARLLNTKGIYVVGNDHLGHGASVVSEEDYGYFAEKDGNACVIGDMHTLREMTEKKYPGIPYFILGHSMGSFLTRQYITEYGRGLAGAVISGTGYQSKGTLRAAKAVCRTIATFKGWKYRSKMVDNMALGSYNKKFEPARTANDWLTRDTAIVDAYCANPWNNFRFTLNAYYNLFTGLEKAE
ncbi:MAG: alpha/beta hydrolase, partial [Eubacterium sp.]|nr:alpha/beta hydrolase [Eubacterium sp.]